MIDLVTDVLETRGLVPADRLDACNVYIGKNLVFHAYDKDGDFVVVKIQESANAETEFAAMQLAYSAMPELVPRPLALDRVGDKNLLLIEGVAHEALANQAVERHGPALAEAMHRFIDRVASRFVAPGDREPHSVTLARMIDTLDGPEAEALRGIVRGLDLAVLDRPTAPHRGNPGAFLHRRDRQGFVSPSLAGLLRNLPEPEAFDGLRCRDHRFMPAQNPVSRELRPGAGPA